ncbi:MAG: hypothetical protein ACKOTB_00090, partial [Planctomycetia bacterium]
EEATRLRQPFGGVRRHINSLLATRRARQVESVSLAATMARLGRAEAAERLAGAVPAASARMAARLTSLVVAARLLVRRSEGGAEAALDRLDAATVLLKRAVDCGALVDPWNILGLGGQFPLHEPGGESLTDSRVDDLVALTESIVDGDAEVWRQAASGCPASAVDRLGNWWDAFATTTVSGVPHLSGREVRDSAREVIDSLARRRETAPAPPPPDFWRREVASFSSPHSHAQATECLLGEGDLDGATGLLVHWASLLEGDVVGRTGGEWMAEASRWMARAVADPSPAGRARVRRFLELVEANTSAIVEVVEAAASGREPGDDRPPRREGGDRDEWPDDDRSEEEDEVGESVASAYESMVWRDSADDGVDGGMLDMEGAGGSTLSGVAAVEEAAEFLTGLFGLLADAVVAWCSADA